MYFSDHDLDLKCNLDLKFRLHERVDLTCELSHNVFAQFFWNDNAINVNVC